MWKMEITRRPGGEISEATIRHSSRMGLRSEDKDFRSSELARYGKFYWIVTWRSWRVGGFQWILRLRTANPRFFLCVLAIHFNIPWDFTRRFHDSFSCGDKANRTKEKLRNLQLEQDSRAACASWRKPPTTCSCEMGAWRDPWRGRLCWDKVMWRKKSFFWFLNNKIIIYLERIGCSKTAKWPTGWSSWMFSCPGSLWPWSAACSIDSFLRRALQMGKRKERKQQTTAEDVLMYVYVRVFVLFSKYVNLQVCSWRLGCGVLMCFGYLPKFLLDPQSVWVHKSTVATLWGSLGFLGPGALKSSLPSSLKFLAEPGGPLANEEVLWLLKRVGVGGRMTIVVWRIHLCRRCCYCYLGCYLTIEPDFQSTFP